MTRLGLLLLRPARKQAEANLRALTALRPDPYPDIVDWVVEWDACLRCGAANHLTGYHVTGVLA
jgi:hypothetical protein